MPHCQVAFVDIGSVPSVLIVVQSCFLAEVLLLVPEVTNYLAHFYIHVMEEKIGNVPPSRIFIYIAVSIRYILPEI